jgi:hypothetical protein
MSYLFDDDNSTHLLPLITGRRLARLVNHLTLPEKALFGADLSLGRSYNLERPTFGQSAALVGVCSQYVGAAASIAKDEEKRAALLAGEIELQALVRPPKTNGNGNSLAEHLAQATDEELVEAARTVGVKAVWERMVEPLL